MTEKKIKNGGGQSLLKLKKPETNYEVIKITDLVEYEKNARTHSADQIDQLKNSIKEFGFTNPVLVDENNVLIAGHGRATAARELGFESIPAIRVKGLTETQIKALRIADNQLALNAGWDEELLSAELEELRLDDFNLDLIGFSLDELEDLLKEPETEPEEITEGEVSEPPKEPITRPGDLWVLGKHRLLCGDSTDAKCVDRLMNGKRGRILFTSPPYSDMREYNGGKDLSVDNLINFISSYKPYTDYQCVNLGLQRKDGEIYEYWQPYIEHAKKSGYKLMAWNVWNKNMCGSIGQQSAFIPICHEWIFVFGTDYYDINRTWEKKDKSVNHSSEVKRRNADGSIKVSSSGDTSNPLKKMESVINVFPESSNIRSLHPATFPVKLPSEYINAMTDKNDIVIEPFGGSGTTLIAAEQLNRACYTMELDPAYCDVILKRWQDLTGKDARREDGKKFNDL